MESIMRQQNSASEPVSSPPPPPQDTPIPIPIGRFAPWQQEECSKSLNRIILSRITAESSELSLVKHALDSVCAELPFLRTPWLLDQVEQPGAICMPDASWQAILNTLIASSICFKTVIGSFAEMAVYSWAFFRNAYAVLPELLLHGDSLGASQAVMAMAMFMSLSADTRSAALLLSIAIRMQISAGLHIQASADGNLSPTDQEDRGRLFWAAYILDIDTSVNTGLPPAHASLNVAVNISERWLSTSLRDTVFRLRAELAGIQSRAGAQLTILAVPSEADLVALESELDAWTLRVPLEIRPDYECGNKPLCATDAEVADVPVVMLHLVYYNCRTMVCWAFARLAAFQALQHRQPISAAYERAPAHRSMARSSARATLHSLSQFPTQSFADLWRALCYPISASIALLAIVCKEPAHPEAQTDLSLFASFVRFLEGMVRDQGCDLERVLDGVAKFEKVAKDAVGAAFGSVMPVNPALWPLSIASGCTSKAIANKLTCSAHYPMYVAQSFIGNTPNIDTEVAKQIAEILEIPWGENGYGPFVPDSLIPATHGFMFGSSNPGSHTPPDAMNSQVGNISRGPFG
ncbi:hypothetical protein B0T25DRAFT_561584 [Lasiosphaeria hispida]|uniref:Xylanolytic transcriptional activator regulatory domain-containing protein n=1 Tax=Lasiosphaeria hispida TaxID=260671 RepID=A0AAJ0HTR9_9PEZI|nr:hypothetical protein B0T25DRAFT_561584 [Lasiosphaeria hispida]